MSAPQERQEILEMVAAGKITAAEAAELLNSLGTAVPGEEKALLVSKTGNGKKASWLHIQVNDLHSGRRKVSVNFPIGFLKFGLRLGRHFAPELEHLDLNEAGSMLAEMEGTTLVDVMDEESGEHVHIYVD